MSLREDFKIIRRNAFANPSLYDGRYTSKDFNKAYIEWLEDLLIRENRKKTIVYRVFDEDWEELMSFESMCEFASDQAVAFMEDFDELYLDDEEAELYRKVLALAEKVLNGYRIETFEEIELVFQVRYFEYEEITL